MTLTTGTITKITDRDSDFRIQFLDDLGGRGEIYINKREALMGEFIASAEGLPLKIDTENNGFVHTATIDRSVVLRRYL